MIPSTLEHNRAKMLSFDDSKAPKLVSNDEKEGCMNSAREGDGFFVGANRVTDERLGFWDLWRSLPKPCKLFLVLCVVQAFVIGSFATTELAKEGMKNLQDLVLLLVSSVVFLCIVADAFWHENAYQLLVSMASGGLNLAQLIIYSVSVSIL